jgi:hypothetical protein
MTKIYRPNEELRVKSMSSLLREGWRQEGDTGLVNDNYPDSPRISRHMCGLKIVLRRIPDRSGDFYQFETVRNGASAFFGAYRETEFDRMNNLLNLIDEGTSGGAICHQGECSFTQDWGFGKLHCSRPGCGKSRPKFS